MPQANWRPFGKVSRRDCLWITRALIADQIVEHEAIVEAVKQRDLKSAQQAINANIIDAIIFRHLRGVHYADCGF